MAVLKRKTRIVSFRCSEEEYAVLKERCIAEGGRSISDYARLSACSFASDRDQLRKDLETESVISQLKGQIQELDTQMRRLVDRIDSPAAKCGPQVTLNDPTLER